MLIKTAIIVAIVLIGGTMMLSPADAINGWKLAIDNLGQTLGMITCANGQVVKWDDALGQWTCADDNGTAKLNVQSFDGPMVSASTPKIHSSIAECLDGTLIGGGHRSVGFTDTVEGIIIESRKISDQEWRVQFRYDSDGSGTYTFRAIAMCASITP